MKKMFSGVSRKSSRTFQVTDLAQSPFTAAWSGEDMEPETFRYVVGTEKADASDHSLHSLSLQAQVPREASQLNASYSQVSGPEHHFMLHSPAALLLSGAWEGSPSSSPGVLLSQCWANLISRNFLSCCTAFDLSGFPWRSKFH